MIDRRGFLSRAAVLLGTLVALPMVTLATAPSAPAHEPRVGACEPDGTAVRIDAFPWYALQRELNDYARARGYMVELERTDQGRIAGLITPINPRREDRVCFFVPPSLEVVGAAQEYARRRVRDGIRQLDHAPAWTDE